MRSSVSKDVKVIYVDDEYPEPTKEDTWRQKYKALFERIFR